MISQPVLRPDMAGYGKGRAEDPCDPFGSCRLLPSRDDDIDGPVSGYAKGPGRAMPAGALNTVSGYERIPGSNALPGIHLT